MGGTGVHLFFVLSGFLLFLPFARHLLLDSRRPSATHFYKRRLLRIIPAYYVALVVVWAVFERDTIVDPVRQFVTHALLVHNYSAETYKGLDGPTWTMAVEVQFYALMPLIALAAVWLLARSRRALILGGVVLLLASPVASAATVALKRVVPEFEGHATILSTFHFMSTFGCGILAACVYTLAMGGRISPHRPRQIARAGLVLFVVLFAMYAFRGELGLEVDLRDYYTFALVMGVMYAGLLLHVVLSPTAGPGRLLSRPSIRFLGDISYSVYLLHLPIQYYWLAPWGSGLGGAWPVVVMIGGTVLVVIPLATLSFWFVERPFLARK
jgi:peptidoglycan/LPS O-acetylase OafA/YrhL